MKKLIQTKQRFCDYFNLP